MLTVLLLVAVLATLAAVVLDDIRFGLRRAANAEAVGQARWYALGAETLAAGQIGLDQGARALQGGDLVHPVTDHGAVVGGEAEHGHAGG